MSSRTPAPGANGLLSVCGAACSGHCTWNPTCPLVSGFPHLGPRFQGPSTLPQESLPSPGGVTSCRPVALLTHLVVSPSGRCEQRFWNVRGQVLVPTSVFSCLGRMPGTVSAGSRGRSLSGVLRTAAQPGAGTCEAASAALADPAVGGRRHCHLRQVRRSGQGGAGHVGPVVAATVTVHLLCTSHFVGCTQSVLYKYK